METKNIGVVLLPKPTLLHWHYILSSFVKNGEDGNGLKFETFSHFFFQALKLFLEEKVQKYYGLLSC